MHKVVVFSVTAFVLFALIVIYGCGGGGGTIPPGEDRSPPTINNAQLQYGSQRGVQLTIPPQGGDVQVEATITDPSGVDIVILKVPELNDFSQRLNLSPDNKVTSTVTLPLNSSATDKTYFFQMFVRDMSPRRNEATVYIGSVVVQGTGSPPPPPF